MATIQDVIGADGILRTVLSKNINDKVYALYPRTDSSVVMHDDTTVQFKLNTISSVVYNVQNLINSLYKDMESLTNTVYDKDYITGKFEEITNTLNKSKSDIIILQQDLSGLNYYTQDEVNQKVMSVRQDVNMSISRVNTMLTELSAYINTSFDSSMDVSTKIEALLQDLHIVEDDLAEEVQLSFKQVQVDLDSQINDRMSEYYKMTDVDSTVQRIDEDIKNANIEISTLRGDTVAMNTRSENNLRTHVDSAENSIISNTNEQINLMSSSIHNKIQAENDARSAEHDDVLSTIGALSTNLSVRFAEIQNMLTSIGAQSESSAIEYESADEEEF